MRTFFDLKPMAIRHPVLGWPDEFIGGAYVFLHKGTVLNVIASWGGGWDHVSVSLQDRCPTWEEMDAVKRRFFRSNEAAMQLHVAESDHINVHSYCLHLWRPQERTIPLPPKEFV